MANPKTGLPAYICGPLTELSIDDQLRAKAFYVKIANLCEIVTGVRAFVPHEHYDPIVHAKYSPTEVDRAERKQVCEATSLLIVVALAPSWGGGIEVEMARESGVPAILLCEKEKLDNRKISRLLQGNGAFKGVVTYRSEEDALKTLAPAIDFCLHLPLVGTAVKAIVSTTTS